MSISEEQAKAISDFMQAVRQLRKSNVIRSDRFLGDIGEFLASSEYELALATSGRQQGHDTEGNDDRVQIKFHNSPTRTNINLGNPKKYERAIVVIGPDSLLHPGSEYAGQHCFYEFTSGHITENFNTGKAYSCGKKLLGTPNRAVTIKSSGPANAAC